MWLFQTVVVYNIRFYMRVVISGGGTGGHIFPAISIANAIKAKNPSAQILFVGALGKMEMERVPAAGYEIVGLPVAGLQRSFALSNFLFPFKLISSIWKAKKIIKNFKPDVVVGVGGYASGPVLRVASNKHIPTLIQEQNSYPGLTNKILSKKVSKICVAYPNMERFFPADKIVLLGNPIRQTLLVLPTREAAAAALGFDPSKKMLFLTGGSLGARTLNEAFIKDIELLIKADINILWQTGKYYHSTVNEAVKNIKSPQLKVVDFVGQMDMAYALADLVISRAGAGAIAEIALLGKPAIFVPSPNVTEDHQTKNAMVLVDANSAALVKDVDAVEKLVPKALDMISDVELLSKYASNVKQFAYPNASSSIADEVLKLVKA